MDWTNWHQHYDTSLVLLTRLRIVREQIRAALDECGDGPIRIVSICAGDGRDVIEALTHHPRRSDVVAALLDTDEPSLDRGRAAAAEARLDKQLQFLCADATVAGNYQSLVPADIIIVSGVLGHVTNAGILHFLGSLSMLSKTGGSIIWNRHLVANHGAADVRLIRENLQRCEFDEVHFEVTSRTGFAVGRAKFRGNGIPLNLERPIFEFVGLDTLMERNAAGGGQGHGKPLVESILAGNGPDEPEHPEEVAESLPACFERQAALHPDRTALGSGSWQPTYEELNNAANRLAQRLLSRSGESGERVVLLMEHDTLLMAAMLAVLKSGKTVVVLNPTDPPARLRQVMKDAEPGGILADSAHQGLARQLSDDARCVVCVEDHLLGAPASNPGRQVPPDSIAFLVYTSGSTGPPKGVMQSHRNILHKAMRVSGELGLREDDRIILLASLSGGQGVNTTWCALSNGVSLCPFPTMTRGVTGLADWMDHHGISVFVSSASVFRHFMRTIDGRRRFERIRLVWLASEPATAEDFESFRRHFAREGILLHTLASSETGVITRLRLGQNDDCPGGWLPVGRAVEGIKVLLLDEHGFEVPHGETGEIVVRSRHLSAGYWRDDALTAQRFSESTGSDGLRTFRTGDRGRLNAGGMLMFMGRRDTRVNVRGYRVELSEVEAALSLEPPVERAVVCACSRPTGDVQLVAYVRLRDGHAVSGGSLRESLRDTLPAHMIPAAFVFLDLFPLTPHGKIDREALRQIKPATPEPAPADEPRTDTEELLAAIWSGVFEHGPCSRQDHFFDLGGDSLTAAVIAARVDAALHVQLDLRMFADHPVLADLAAAVDALRASGGSGSNPVLPRAARDKPLPLSFQQERVWKFSRTPDASAGYVTAACHLIRGPLRVELLRECINHLACRHEMLRTSFPLEHGSAVQLVHPPAPVPVPLVDLSGTSDPEVEAKRLFREDVRRPFDLAVGPMLRLTLIRLRENEHHLLRVEHHIICDAGSWDRYFRELGVLYEANLRGEKPPLPEFEPLQYADYAAWQRHEMRPDGPAYRESVSWWKNLLAPAPPRVELPFKRPSPLPEADPSEGHVRVGIDPSLSSGLDQIGRECCATFHAVRLAAFVATLATETGQQEIAIGNYVSNRNRVETQGMFGYFTNLITLRFLCNGAQTFREWLAAVRDLAAETQARGEIPYELLCEELRKSGVIPPEIRVIFGTLEQPDMLSFGGLELTRLSPHAPLAAVMPWEFTLLFTRRGSEHHIVASFDARIHDPSEVSGFIHRLISFLNAVSHNPDLPMGRQPDREADGSGKSREPWRT